MGDQFGLGHDVTAANQLFSLVGRVALITGASRGLGLAMAEGLAEAGATVVANGRSADTLEAVARALRERGLKADTSPFDVTDHRAAQAAIDAIIARYGRLDILKTAKAIGLEEAKCGILIRLGIARTIDQ